MSLWTCPVHGLYGGDVFCPVCRGTGDYTVDEDGRLGSSEPTALAPPSGVEPASGLQQSRSSTDATLLALADRCEAAGGPDGELDELISAAIQDAVREVQEDGRTAFHSLDGARWVCVAVGSYTASIDAAMMLVPEGCGFLLTSTHTERWAQIVLESRLPDGTLLVGPSLASSKCVTVALALAAASLRARGRVASGMSAGTAETAKQAQGQRPASPIGVSRDAQTEAEG